MLAITTKAEDQNYANCSSEDQQKILPGQFCTIDIKNLGV